MENSVNMIRVSLAEKLKQQQDEIERLKRERDDMKSDMRQMADTTSPCGFCVKRSKCRNAKLATILCNNFEWRGVCEENSGGEGT